MKWVKKILPQTVHGEMFTPIGQSEEGNGHEMWLVRQLATYLSSFSRLPLIYWDYQIHLYHGCLTTHVHTCSYDGSTSKFIASTNTAVTSRLNTGYE